VCTKVGIAVAAIARVAHERHREDSTVNRATARAHRRRGEAHGDARVVVLRELGYEIDIARDPHTFVTIDMECRHFESTVTIEHLTCT
jgi:hypothetical protein